MDELIAFLKTRQPVNLLMVLINVVVFLVLSFLGNTESAQFMLNHGACYAPLVTESHEYYRIVTCMFLHFGLQHLVNNMLVLIFLGDILETVAGKVRYLVIYLGGGIAGNILSIMWSMRTDDYAVSAGASGAVFAVIGALIYLVIRSRGRINALAGRRLLFMAALSILQGLTSIGIDNTAHIGGLAAGFLLAFITGAGRKLQTDSH
jgi:rhomboid protease GluP